MMAIALSISAWVFDGASVLRFSEQLTNSARRSEKSWSSMVCTVSPARQTFHGRSASAPCPTVSARMRVFQASARQHDGQPPGAVDALDAAELDVRGRGGSRDHRDRPAGADGVVH